MVLGDTSTEERDSVIEQFKAQRIKFLVNVSVLTTGFDAPHVDIIAILRPTESVSLYQQIVGRGLRLSEGKTDCLVLDYTGVPHDIFSPQIADRRPTKESLPVKVDCPRCHHQNDFWGVLDEAGAAAPAFRPFPIDHLAALIGTTLAQAGPGHATAVTATHTA